MARDSFELKLASPFRLDVTVRTLRRRPDNVVDRWDGTTYRRVLPLPAGPVEVAVTQVASPEPARLKVAVAGQPVSAAVRAAVNNGPGAAAGAAHRPDGTLPVRHAPPTAEPPGSALQGHEAAMLRHGL